MKQRNRIFYEANFNKLQLLQNKLDFFEPGTRMYMKLQLRPCTFGSCIGFTEAYAQLHLKQFYLVSQIAHCRIELPKVKVSDTRNGDSSNAA